MLTGWVILGFASAVEGRPFSSVAKPKIGERGVPPRTDQHINPV